ncbi:MAG: NAD(P)-binding protein [Candidatus Electryonea clarkiae]|nr:NAD(P)-binding protein [Candidatus Electryonea clarkiae]MDP8288352.1 NAD(P)-binding protein [Candidatus Electryonea clarkiae]
MPIVRKKKKKLKAKALSGGSGSGSHVISDLRPVHVEKLAPCMSGCPQGTLVRDALNIISLHEKHGISLEESFNQAWYKWTEVNPLPSILGRVCPHPCESECNRKEKEGDSAVSINQVERFLGDWGLNNGLKLKKIDADVEREEKVAIIGSGPAGLGCAFHLARKGYKVKMFEAFSEPGGMLRYGIPAYRMPRDLLSAEIKRILDLGVELETNVTIGKDIPYEKISDEFDAVFIGIGAHKGRKLGVPGEDAENVVTGAAFLNMVNSGEPPDVGDKVVVVGGGDSAMDAARVSLRMGADVTVVYRRTRNEMPAIEEDIVGAEEEGIKFNFLCTPIEVFTKDDKAYKMKCQKMELGEPDDSGRRRPVPIEEYFDLECTYLIPSISQEPEFEGLENLKAGPREWVHADDFMQSKDVDDNFFAGGDVLDLGLVTIALYQGRRAAETIHARFLDLPVQFDPKPPLITPKEWLDPDDGINHKNLLFDHFEQKPRVEKHELPVAERFEDPEREISETITAEEVLEEALRCMSCGACIECGQCWTYCQDSCIEKPLLPGDKYAFKLDNCKGCKKCEEVCPCGYIDMK